MCVQPTYKLSDNLQLCHTFSNDDNQIGREKRQATIKSAIANRHLR